MPAPKQPPAPVEPTHGLVLELGGAPPVPHWIQGVHGYFVPGVPAPVGGAGEMPVPQAEALADNPSIPVSLVVIPEGEVEALREEQAEIFDTARKGVSRLRPRDLSGGRERDHVDAERDTLTTTPKEN